MSDLVVYNSLQCVRFSSLQQFTVYNRSDLVVYDSLQNGKYEESVDTLRCFLSSERVAHNSTFLKFSFVFNIFYS